MPGETKVERTELVLRSRRVVRPEGVGPADVHVRGGVITAVGAPGPVPEGSRLVDHGELVLMPGVVDTHVHINEPGRAEWEGFLTATRAAAAGGVTTLVDMPLNSIPPTTTLAGLEAKLAAAEGKLHVDVGFWGGVLPDNTADLEPLYEAGVFGFKCFLLPSGVDEFPWVGRAELERAMPVLARLGAKLLVHAELEGPIEAATRRLEADGADPRRYRTFLESRPPSAEEEAIRLMIELARRHGSRVHIVHLASAGALPALRAARAEGLPLTAETCLHYLHFAAEQVPDGATEYKCCPPIRDEANREALWQAVAAGDVDFVISDHSPCTPDLKCQGSGDFHRAWGGISSVQFDLSVLWTEARRRGFGLPELARWICLGPARFAGLEHLKGSIAPGRDADLVAWDPDADFEVRPGLIRHRHPLTPYRGERLLGLVETTYLRGRPVYERGMPPEEMAPIGRPLRREDR
jgi:allantoinase